MTEEPVSAVATADRPAKPIDMVTAGGLLKRVSPPLDAVDALLTLAGMLDREAATYQRFGSHTGRSTSVEAIKRCASIARQFARQVERRVAQTVVEQESGVVANEA